MPLALKIPNAARDLYLVLTPVRGKPTVSIELRENGESGPLQYADQGDLTKASYRRRLLNALSTIQGLPALNDAYLVQALEQYKTWLESPTPKTVFRLFIRHKLQQHVQAQVIDIPDPEEALHFALETFAVGGRPDLIITWPIERRDALACLDIDYHDLAQPPSAEYTAALANAVRPQPFVWWNSHGGGLHLIYRALEGFDACELAAAAALHLSQIDGTATYEIKADTRHPRSPRST